jgi:peptidoglycan hydrolase CwlO-like protein
LKQTVTSAVALVAVVSSLGSLEYYTYESVNNQISDTKADLNVQIFGLQGTITSLRDTVTSLHNNLTSLQNAFTPLQNEVTSPENTATSLQGTLTSLQKRACDNNTAVSDISEIEH